MDTDLLILWKLPEKHPVSENDKTANKKGAVTAGLLVSWVAQVIQIASGFVIPRMIDTGAGSVTLGVWDFGWTLVSYFSLVEGGMGSSVNRYIALERGKGDQRGVNRIVSSAALMQRIVSVLILILTCVLAWGVPYKLKGASLDLVNDARWLVFLLGTASGVSLFGAIYTGILTGCQRWASHHAVYAATNILSVIAMFTVLWLGLGIIALGVVQLGREILGRLIRQILSYRACPGLAIKVALADRVTMRSMLGFEGRMVLGKISGLLLAQTTSILIVGYLGPISLALFTRPRSLVRQASLFPEKYALMLVPSVAWLLGSNQTDEVRNFVMSSCRTGIYMSLPIMVFLWVNGSPLVWLWMGGNYADPLLIGLLTLAFASEVFYQPLDNIMLGLNLHGRPACVMLAAAVVAIVCSWIALARGWGLHGVAIAIIVPWTFAHGIYLPFYFCRCLKIPISTFLWAVWRGPLACGIPFALILVGVRCLFPDQPTLALSVGITLGGVFLTLCYWVWVFPTALKRQVLVRLGISGRHGTATVGGIQEDG